MLTRERLVELYRELQTQKVLSVYLDAEAHDPAKRSIWRKRFEHEVARARDSLNGGSGDDIDQFDDALDQVKGALASFDAFLPDRGWVGFATPGRIWNAESVPASMPDLVRWERGIRVAPYVRALKQDRDVITVLVDSRRSRLFRYRAGQLEEAADLRADTFLGDLSDMGVSKGAATHTGVRGSTATDAAQRYLEVGSERMMKQVVERAVAMAGERGFLVVGGSAEAQASLVSLLPKTVRSRVLEVDSLHLEMSAPEVKAAAEAAGSVLTRRLQDELLTEVVNLARSGGRGCLGPEETVRALQERRVDTLLLSRTLIRGNPDLADQCVGTAFEQQADVEELSDHGAERLDSEGEGIAARLRYALPGLPEEDPAS